MSTMLPPSPKSASLPSYEPSAESTLASDTAALCNAKVPPLNNTNEALDGDDGGSSHEGECDRSMRIAQIERTVATLEERIELRAQGPRTSRSDAQMKLEVERKEELELEL